MLFDERIYGLVLLICCAACIHVVESLVCYESDKGETKIVENNSWTYCTLVPIVKNIRINGSQFGIGPQNDNLAAFNRAYDLPLDGYRILTMCIYERFDLLPMMPGKVVEFMFRCVCNYDLCNSETNFAKYLSSIKSENFE